MRHGDAGRDVVRKEQFLDRDGVGLELHDELFHILLDLHKAARQRQPGGCSDRAVIEELRLPALRLDQPEADNGDSRVNTEDPHAHHLP